MKPKTEELLYLLLWTCDMAMRPTFRNLTDSFEAWAYRNGFHRQLAELERQKFLTSTPRKPGSSPCVEAALRLTRTGRLHALGGRDPERQWSRSWDGKWRLVLFDFPVTENKCRNRMRSHLRRRGFGYLQDSVWITPDPLKDERIALAGTEIPVECLLLLEARPCAGESNEEIVAAAWNFASINHRYAEHLKILRKKPALLNSAEESGRAFRRWASEERASWLAAVSEDPLLPARLLPPGYLGRSVWKQRLEVLSRAGRELRQFRLPRHETFEHVSKSFVWRSGAGGGRGVLEAGRANEDN